jgi:hypothetical protein
MAWRTDQRHDQAVKDEVARLWAEGHSARDIAAMMARFPGLLRPLTRNAVIGMVHRARVKSGGAATRKALKPRKLSKPRKPPAKLQEPYLPPKPPVEKSEHRPKAKYPPRPVEVAKKPAKASVRWVPILKTGLMTCRYTTDGKAFCNSQEGHPWCPEHRKVVFTPGGKYPMRRVA